MGKERSKRGRGREEAEDAIRKRTRTRESTKKRKSMFKRKSNQNRKDSKSNLNF